MLNLEGFWNTIITNPINIFTLALVIVASLQCWLNRCYNKAFITAQRAFIFLNSFETHPFPEEFWIIPKWENSGTTPTGEMTNYISWKFFNIGELTDQFDFPDLDSAGPTSTPVTTRLFVGPKSIQRGSIHKIKKNFIEAAAKGEGRILIWGWAKYRDIFNKKTQHETRFSYEILPTIIGEKDGKTGYAISFPQYGQYACTDEECYPQSPLSKIRE